jgi:hypothetical protein
MKTAMRYAACLCALLLLTACGAHKPLIKTEVVQVPVDRYVSVPEALTGKVPEPPPPAPMCTLLGKPVVCALDGLLWIGLWRELLERVNEDRATTAKLSDQPVAAAGNLTTRDAGPER